MPISERNFRARDAGCGAGVADQGDPVALVGEGGKGLEDAGHEGGGVLQEGVQVTLGDAVFGFGVKGRGKVGLDGVEEVVQLGFEGGVEASGADVFKLLLGVPVDLGNVLP